MTAVLIRRRRGAAARGTQHDGFPGSRQSSHDPMSHVRTGSAECFSIGLSLNSDALIAVAITGSDGVPGG